MWRLRASVEHRRHRRHDARPFIAPATTSKTPPDARPHRKRRLDGAQRWVWALPDFLRRLSDAYRRTSLLEVVTLDAGMTSADNARAVAEAELRYVMAVEQTQPTLLAEAQRL